MLSEIESYISCNCTWEKLPINVKKLLGNSKIEYEKQVVEYSIKTQQHYLGNLVQHIFNDQKAYYRDLVYHSRSHLMMFPYHLSELLVRGLRLTPFQYYIDIMSDIMTAEKSYDSLPNFTAADCLRLIGIGRNQYIDLMNQCRSTRKLFRRKNTRELLPALPKDITIEPWWIVKAGCITEDDIRHVTDKEKHIVDMLIDAGPQRAGALEKESVHTLYTKGLIYLDVVVEGGDRLCVPPLEGFVMNRVLGDYLENLMYKIFVSIDEHTCVNELAKVLQIDLFLVKVAVSLFCRLGFAQLKAAENPYIAQHPSWGVDPELKERLSPTTEDQLLLDLESALAETVPEDADGGSLVSTPVADPHHPLLGSAASSLTQRKRIAFLYDSTLTAFLMMGNLSPGLKNHAVTMFEVGKMLDEGLDSLVVELDKIQRSDSEGEAQRYFEHALTLRTTVGFLRHNPGLGLSSDAASTPQRDPPLEDDFLEPCVEPPPALDLIRWESLSNLDPATTARLLNKNYKLLISMAPLSYEIPRVEGAAPPHFGPPIPEVNSVWFKLFLYHLTSSGPPSLLLPKGERLSRLPRCLSVFDKALVTPWGHDSTVVAISALLFTVNEALLHSPVFIQAYGWYHDVRVQHIPLPLEENSLWLKHAAISRLRSSLDLRHSFGYIKMVSFIESDGSVDGEVEEITTGVPKGICPSDEDVFLDVSVDDGTDADFMQQDEKQNGGVPLDAWLLLECHFGLPLFDARLNAEVSSRVVQKQLFHPDSVSKFVSSSESLVDKLQEFLSQWEGESNTFQLAQRHQGLENASHLPLPTRPLLFTGGNAAAANTTMGKSRQAFDTEEKRDSKLEGRLEFWDNSS